MYAMLLILGILACRFRDFSMFHFPKVKTVFSWTFSHQVSNNTCHCFHSLFSLYKKNEFYSRSHIDLNPNEKLPVIFYIHGGAFIMGSSNEFYGPDFLIEQRVILVSFTLWICAVETIAICSFDAIITGHYQLSCGRFWVSVVGITWIFWQYGPERSTNGTQMDSQKYPSLWWRQ